MPEPLQTPAAPAQSYYKPGPSGLFLETDARDPMAVTKLPDGATTIPLNGSYNVGGGPLTNSPRQNSGDPYDFIRTPQNGYAAPNPAPFDRGPGSSNPASVAGITPTPPRDLQTNIEEQRRFSQASIDAISAGYDSKLADEEQAGKVREARTRAINQNSGNLGGDFATAAAEETEAGNRKVTDSIKMEKSARIAEILSNSDARARQQQELETSRYRTDTEAALNIQKEIASQAKEDIKTLGGQGVSGSYLKTSYPQLYDHLIKQTGFTPLELDSYLMASHPGLDLKNVNYQKIGDNLVMTYLDPATKKLVSSTYAVPGSGDYDGFTVAPDGTAIFYNKGTGEYKIAGQEGQFAKDPNSGKTINPGKYGTLAYDSETKTWKKITGGVTPDPGTPPGTTPPPASGLYTKQTYNRLKSSGIDQNLADKFGSLILQGIPLDVIREAMRTDKIDPTLLDNYDRVVGIKSFLKNHPANSDPGIKP